MRAAATLLPVLTLAAMALAWEGVVYFGLIAEFWISRPSDIGAWLWRELVRGDVLWMHIWVTLAGTLLGFALGSGLGVVAGYLFARNRWLYLAFDPLLVALYSMPRVALAPLFILWFGLGILSKVAIAVSLVFFVLLLNTYNGYRSVDQDLVNAIRTTGASRRFVARRVILPSCLPWVFAGMRASIGLALIGTTVGEMIGSQYGIGLVIARASGTFDTAAIFGGLVIVAAMGLALTRAVELVESRLFRWRVEVVT